MEADVLYNIISNESFGEYEEKNSRFIARLMPVTSEEEAMEYLSMIRKKYYDAKHNCYAMIIGSKMELVRSSDDKEPSGTAGKPILEVLNGANLTNVIAVVTRYFGGTLLGTGGLVRAYSKAVKDALENCEILSVAKCKNMEICIPYSLTDTLMSYFSKNNVTVTDTQYLENVTFSIRFFSSQYDEILKDLQELTMGRARIEELKEGYYPIKNENNSIIK